MQRRICKSTVSAAITASCKAGLCGGAMKSIDPSIVGAVTVLVMTYEKIRIKSLLETW